MLLTGLDKPPNKTRVVVAMSGGVDSSVAAALLHEAGYDVVGVTLQLYDYGEALRKKGACCAGADIRDAARVARERGFPHYVLDYENTFQNSVIDEFADAYIRGETPVPCVRCNQTVKFRDLLIVARDLGADCMVTGHYVQRKESADAPPALCRAVDPLKDQSYFLFATTREQLDFLRFPLGGMTKSETRAHATRLGLVTADKPDSQDICFVPGGDYAAVVRRLRPQAARPGEIVHIDGRVLGHHEGIVGYTIGQRRGLGIGGGHNPDNDPFYVVEINADAARVIVGPKEALARNILFLRDCNWLDAPEGEDISLKFRSMMEPIPAQVYILQSGRAKIMLDTPHYGIAPGQAAVCYRGERVIGGGWIERTA
ncbi:MAG: tRNA 2-thiouridine(34) synthase MnmA [Rhodospirillales bacterium]|nr:tRNA 2-thiouridine(34) synthase MnmA [Rhodospirillales bacterium]